MGRLVNAEQLAAWVEASCQAQGLPVRVTDPATVQTVRVLLVGGQGGHRAQARSASTGPTVRRSQPPQRRDPGRVEASGSQHARLDDGVVQDHADDGGLPVEVEVGPLSA